MVPHDHGRRPTNSKLRALASSGDNVRSIAAQLDRTIAAVRGRAGQLKIPITPQKRAKDGEGEAEVTDNDAPPDIPDVHVNFDAPAILRKWPSLNNQRRTEGTGPTARWVTASGSSWPSRLPCDTYMRFMLHRAPVGGCRLVGRYHHRTRATSGFSLMILPLSLLVTGSDALQHLGQIATRNP